MARTPAELLVPGRPLTLAGVADGAEGLVVSDLARAVAARANAPATSLVVVCRDGPRMAALARALGFFAPDLVVEQFPAWDCLPYDRVSPHAGLRRPTHDRAVTAGARPGPRSPVAPAHHRQRHPPARAGTRLRCEASAFGRARQYARDGQHHRLARAQRIRARLDGARARRLRGAWRHHRSLPAGHGRAGTARFLWRHAGNDP